MHTSLLDTQVYFLGVRGGTIMNNQFAGALCAGMFSLSVVSVADAALLGRLPATPGGIDYQAYYNPELDITWVADVGLLVANYEPWDVANQALDDLNTSTYLGYDDWRFPVAARPDPTCDEVELSRGYNCTGSEMGHMFYNEFGATAETSVLDTGDPLELAKFVNLFSSDDRNITYFWTGTLGSDTGPGSLSHIAFLFDFGLQTVAKDPDAPARVWAVRDGDVSAVPVPAAVWLFGSGLLGIVGIAKRKKV